jgi:hypothetical protein
MNAGLLTEPAVAKRAKPAKPSNPDPSFGRIELQAPPEWIEELDECAKAMGLKRAGFIRLACNRLMDDERRRKEGR